MALGNTAKILDFEEYNNKTQIPTNIFAKQSFKSTSSISELEELDFFNKLIETIKDFPQDKFIIILKEIIRPEYSNYDELESNYIEIIDSPNIDSKQHNMNLLNLKSIENIMPIIVNEINPEED